MTEAKQRQRASLEIMDYGNLMQYRIRRILLICSSYDAYTLEEDGRIEASINQEYRDLNLTQAPSFSRVSTIAEAMEQLRADSDIDLIISMYDTGRTDVFTFAREVKRLRPTLPFVLLTNFTRDVYKRLDQEDRSGIDHIFCWHGSPDLIMVIIKLIEDRMNAQSDILGVGVQCILLVEDSIRYYSSYLPVIYKLVMQQSNEFIKEALNEQQQTLRKRSRPKILLATNYEDAVADYEMYRENLLGVISDVGFVVKPTDKSSQEKMDAGIDLCRLIRRDNPLMPFLLQSSQASMREEAEKLGVGFIEKYSKTLLQELGEHISREFLFGDFVFNDLDTGEEIGRAHDLHQLQELLAGIPDDVIVWHSEQNHLSRWMFARGLFSIARTLKTLTPADFTSPQSLRAYLVEKIRDYRMLLGQGVVAHFSKEDYGENIWVARIGEGSLGGKGRGLAFMNSMLQQYNFYDKWPGVRIILPRTLIITTEMFDEFLSANGLQYIINASLSDDEILSEFVDSRLPEPLVDKLRTFIKYAAGPLAIRSSSKLEDSHYQPFAGIYSTYMIPLADNEEQTIRMLCKAIKSVYASTFLAASRQYITASANVLSEERMAIVVQEVCGTQENGWFFPTISGVARSLNFYPQGNERPEDGVAEIALGLGKLVVEGGRTLRFSPKYPKNTLQLSTPELTLRDAQREMYVLDLNPEKFRTSLDEGVNMRKLNIQDAKDFRNMHHAASTWDMQSQTISDSSYDEGRKVITFAQILKYDTFPLAEIIADLLKMGQMEMQIPIEIEFAVNLDVPAGAKKIFNFLQIRPIVESENRYTLDWDKVDPTQALLWAQCAVGMGMIEGVSDVVYVKPQAFDNLHTETMAREVASINAAMAALKLGYVLIGPGRWGSSDPFLGVPVKWGDISEAKVIVECGMDNFRIEPSQGTHFFQNLISFGVGYLTINPFMGDGGLDQRTLDTAEIVTETDYVRHVRFPAPLYIFVDGRNNKAIIRQQ